VELRIDQQFARIGLNITRPFLNLKTTLPKIELKIEEPEIRIQAPLPRIYINQRKCFVACSRRSFLEFAWHYADLARSDCLEAIGRISAEGDMLAAVEKGFTIEELAAEAGYEQDSSGVEGAPAGRPSIKAETYPVNMEFKKGKVSLKLYPGRVQKDFQRGKTEAYLAQVNFIKISWVRDGFDEVV